MAKDNTIRVFTAYDIERYHKGMLSPQERHDLEKAALDDPFLADAIEGYATTANVDISADLLELKKRLSDKTEEKQAVPIAVPSKSNSRNWLRIAAMFVILAGVAIVVYQVGFNNKEAELAQAPSPTKNDTSTAAISPTINDTNTTFGATVPQSDSTGTYKIGANKNISGSIASTPLTLDNKGSFYTTDTVKKYIRPYEPVASNPTIVTDDVTAAKTESAMRQQANPVLAGKVKELKDNDSILVVKAEGNASEVYARMGNKAYENRDKRAGIDNSYNLAKFNTFRGRITDNNNNPVPFANVTNVEDNVGTYADARGFFNLTSPDSILNVEVRGLGYNNNNIKLINVPNNQVILQEDRSLNEVVISTKKPNATSRANVTNKMKLENEPEPEDGWDNYDTYLANNLNVPEEYKVKKTGTDQVKLSFEVNQYGEPINIRVEKSLCSSCDQEAIRLVKDGPKWKRKARKGRTTVTISF